MKQNIKELAVVGIVGGILIGTSAHYHNMMMLHSSISTTIILLGIILYHCKPE